MIVLITEIIIIIRSKDKRKKKYIKIPTNLYFGRSKLTN